MFEGQRSRPPAARTQNVPPGRFVASLTARQKAFVAAWSADPHGERAAIRAGYSPRGARKAALRCLRHPEVRAAMQAPAAAVRADQTPLEFLLGIMNNPTVSLARRMRAAVAALPFCHAKVMGAPTRPPRPPILGRFTSLSAPSTSTNSDGR